MDVDVDGTPSVPMRAALTGCGWRVCGGVDGGTQLVLDHFAGDQDTVLRQLQAYPKLQYKVRSHAGRLRCREGPALSERSSGWADQYLGGLVDPTRASINAAAAGSASTAMSVDDGGALPSARAVEMCEKYIELMCQLEPWRVYGFLPTNDKYVVENAC